MMSSIQTPKSDITYKYADKYNIKLIILISKPSLTLNVIQHVHNYQYK